jgi:pimeloyl-ACP methyl ester carboxylesterase
MQWCAQSFPKFPTPDAAPRIIFIFYIYFLSRRERTSVTQVEETVVLVHGLWMPAWAMSLLAWRLRRCGFSTAIFAYPSVRNSLAQNALLLSRFVARITVPRVHFVGHSLGGLLVMQLLAEYPQPRTGRVVLAGSPYRGNAVASKLAQRVLGRRLIGNSMGQWLQQQAAPCTDRYAVGVIAGCRRFGMGALIGDMLRPNDGVVTVEETRVPAASDHIVLAVSHSGMLLSSALARQTCAFLQGGRFLRAEDIG